jgi:HK97 family phage major capsid protein
MARAMLSQVKGSGVEGGFEREIHDELAKSMPPQYKERGGVLVPMQTRAGLDSATATKGAELKFTQAGELIDLLRPQLKLTALGARMLLGLTGPVSFPRQTAGATGSWVGENSGSDVADDNLLIELVTLAMKTYQSSTSFSRQLLIAAQSASIDAEQMVREDLTLDIAQALEKGGIQGTGASNQPRGLLNTSGIGVVPIGANGGAVTFGHTVDLETAIADANGDVGTLSYLSTPGVRGVLKKTAIEAGDSAKVWTGSAGTPGVGEVNGYAAHASNNVPKNLVKGSSGAICHALILGAFRELVGGMWGAVELVVDPFRLKKQGMIEVTSFTVADWIVRRPSSFAAIKDAIVS